MKKVYKFVRRVRGVKKDKKTVKFKWGVRRQEFQYI